MGERKSVVGTAAAADVQTVDAHIGSNAEIGIRRMILVQELAGAPGSALVVADPNRHSLPVGVARRIGEQDPILVVPLLICETDHPRLTDGFRK